MGKNDYTHPSVTPEEEQPSGLVRTIKENRLGIWGTIGVIAVGTAGFLLSSNKTYDGVPEQNKRQPGEIRHGVPASKPGQNYLKPSNGIEVELYTSGTEGNPEWNGMKLTLDRITSEYWGQNFVPVRILIPELDYTAPLPVEHTVLSATVTFPKPEKVTGKTYHCIIRGWDLRKNSHFDLMTLTLNPAEALRKEKK